MEHHTATAQMQISAVTVMFFTAPKEDYCPGKVSGLEQYMSINCQKRCCLQVGPEKNLTKR